MLFDTTYETNQFRVEGKLLLSNVPYSNKVIITIQDGGSSHLNYQKRIAKTIFDG